MLLSLSSLAVPAVPLGFMFKSRIQVAHTFLNLSIFSMKKHSFLALIAFSIGITPLLAQDCELIKKNHEQLKAEHTQLQATVKGVQQENTYLKEALKINTPLQLAESENIDFKILEVVGDKATQAIRVTLLLNNKEANKTLQFSKCRLVDMKGQTYTNYAKFDGKSAREALPTEVPLRAVASFPKALPEVSFVKLIEITHYATTRLGSTRTVEFRDIPVVWK